MPVVHDADGLRLRALAAAIRDVAARARARKLAPDDLAGGTFTITNPGASGTWISFPVINRPQVGILATDGVAKQVVADDDGRLGDRARSAISAARSTTARSTARTRVRSSRRVQEIVETARLAQRSSDRQVAPGSRRRSACSRAAPSPDRSARACRRGCAPCSRCRSSGRAARSRCSRAARRRSTRPARMCVSFARACDGVGVGAGAHDHVRGERGLDLGRVGDRDRSASRTRRRPGRATTA